MQLVGQMLPPQKKQMLEEGWAKLQAYKQTHKVRTAQDAIQALLDLNVPKDFLSKTGGLVNNPVVSKAASVCNVDVDKIKQDINSLNRQQQSVSYETLMADLNKLK